MPGPSSRLISSCLASALILWSCTSPTASKDDRSGVKDESTPSAIALSRADAISKVVEDLRAAGLPEADVETVRAAMEQAGSSFGLQESEPDLNDMLAEMAAAAMRTLGDIASAQANPDLKMKAIAGIAKGLVRYTASKGTTADAIAASAEAIASAVTKSLQSAKVSDAELQVVLKATTEVTIQEMLKVDAFKKTDAASFVGLAVSGIATGLASGGYNATAVTAAVSGISAAAVNVSAASGIKVDGLGNVAKQVTSAILTAFESKDVDATKLATMIVAGVKAGAQAANLPTEFVDKIAAAAAEGTGVDTTKIPQLSIFGGREKLVANPFQVWTKQTKLRVKVVPTGLADVSEASDDWNIIAPPVATTTDVAFEVAHGLTQFRWALVDVVDLHYGEIEGDEFGNDGGSPDEPAEDSDDAEEEPQFGLRKKPTKDQLVSRRQAKQLAALKKRRSALRSAAIAKLNLKWSDWTPVTTAPETSLVGKPEGDYWVVVEAKTNDDTKAYRAGALLTIDKTPPQLTLMTRSEFRDVLIETYGEDFVDEEESGPQWPALYTWPDYGDSIRYTIVPDPVGAATCANASLPSYYLADADPIRYFAALPAIASDFVDLWSPYAYGDQVPFDTRPVLVCAQLRDAAGNVSSVTAKRYVPKLKIMYDVLPVGPTQVEVQQGAPMPQIDQEEVKFAGSTNKDYFVYGTGDDKVEVITRSSSGDMSSAETVFDPATIDQWVTRGKAVAVAGNDVVVAVVGTEGLVVAKSADAGVSWTRGRVIGSTLLRDVDPVVLIDQDQIYVFFVLASSDDEDSLIRLYKAPLATPLVGTVTSVRTYQDTWHLWMAGAAGAGNVYLSVTDKGSGIFVERSANGGASFTRTTPTLPVVRNVHGEDVDVDDYLYYQDPRIFADASRVVLYFGDTVLSKLHSEQTWLGASLPESLFKSGASFPPPPPADDDDDEEVGAGDISDYEDQPHSAYGSLSIGYAHGDPALYYNDLEPVARGYTGSKLYVLFQNKRDPQSPLQVAVSTDFGANWTSKSAGSDANEVIGHFVSGPTQRVYYRDTMAGETRAFVTTDDGASWGTSLYQRPLMGQVVPPVTSCCVHGIVDAAALAGKLLVHNDDGQLFLSADAGSTWTATKSLGDLGSHIKVASTSDRFVMAAAGWFLESIDGMEWSGRVAHLTGDRYGSVDFLAVDGTEVTQGFTLTDKETWDESVHVARYSVGASDAPSYRMVGAAEGVTVWPAHDAAYATTVVDEENDLVTFRRYEMSGAEAGTAVTLQGDISFYAGGQWFHDTAQGLFAVGSVVLRHDGSSWSPTVAVGGEPTFAFADGKPWLLSADGNSLSLLRTSDLGATWTPATVDDFDAYGPAVLVEDGATLRIFYQSRYGVGFHHVQTSDGSSF